MLKLSALAFGMAALLAGCAFEREYTGPKPVAIDDIVKLKHEGISEEVIIAKINGTGVDHRLTTEEIVALKKDGMSDAILQAMLTAPVTPPPKRVVVYRYYDPYPWWYYDRWE